MSRWSRRKQEARQGENVPEPVADAAPHTEETTPDESKSDAEILAELGLKDPDDMDSGDDFSVFMNSAIPARLRNRALRKLWLSNPALANLDDLVEYGEDYTDKATVVENLTTAYKVGKGFVDRLAESGDDESGTASKQEIPEPPHEEAAKPDDENLVEGDDETGHSKDAESAAHQENNPPELPPDKRQRMAFRF